MSYQQALKKAGLPLIRSFMQSTEAVFPYTNLIILEDCLQLGKSELRSCSSINGTKMVKLSKPTVKSCDYFLVVETVTDAFPLRELTRK